MVKLCRKSERQREEMKRKSLNEDADHGEYLSFGTWAGGETRKRQRC